MAETDNQQLQADLVATEAEISSLTAQLAGAQTVAAAIRAQLAADSSVVLEPPATGGGAPPATDAPAPLVVPPWPAKTAFYEPWTSLRPGIWASDFDGSTQNCSSDPKNFAITPAGAVLTLSEFNQQANSGVGACYTTKPNGGGKSGFDAPLPLQLDLLATPGLKNWPGCWLLSPGGWEIDLVEGGSGEIIASLHWNPGGTGKTNGLSLGALSGQHGYTAQVSATEVTFLVDGKQVGAPQKWGLPVPATERFYNLLSIGAGNASWNSPTEVGGTLTERYRMISVPA